MPPTCISIWPCPTSVSRKRELSRELNKTFFPVARNSRTATTGPRTNLVSASTSATPSPPISRSKTICCSIEMGQLEESGRQFDEPVSLLRSTSRYHPQLIYAQQLNSLSTFCQKTTDAGNFVGPVLKDGPTVLLLIFKGVCNRFVHCAITNVAKGLVVALLASLPRGTNTSQFESLPCSSAPSVFSLWRVTPACHSPKRGTNLLAIQT